MDYGQSLTYATFEGKLNVIPQVLLLPHFGFLHGGLHHTVIRQVHWVLIEFWSEAFAFAVGVGEGVVLGDDGGHLRDGAELGAEDLVDEVAEEVGVLLSDVLLCGEHRQLQLALDLPREEVVDDDVVVLRVQPVLDPHQLDHVGVTPVQLVEDPQNTDELLLSARTLAPQHVPNRKSHQVHRLH